MTTAPTLPTTIPLARWGLPAVVDEVLDDHDRTAGALLLLVTDPTGRHAVPMVVDDVPTGLTRDELADFVTTLADITCHASPHGGMALGVGLAGPPADDEQAWWDDVVKVACREAGLAFHGVCLAPARDAQVAATRG